MYINTSKNKAMFPALLELKSPVEIMGCILYTGVTQNLNSPSRSPLKLGSIGNQGVILSAKYFL